MLSVVKYSCTVFHNNIERYYSTLELVVFPPQFSKRNEALSSYLSARELVDVLRDFSSFSCPLEDLLTNLRALQPRYYSIASSPKQVPDTIYLYI